MKRQYNLLLKMGNMGCFYRDEVKLDPKDFKEELRCGLAQQTPQKQYDLLGLDASNSTRIESSAKRSERESEVDNSFFSSNFDNTVLASETEFNGIPWSKLKFLRRDKAFNKQEFLSKLSNDEKQLYARFVRIDRENEECLLNQSTSA